MDAPISSNFIIYLHSDATTISRVSSRGYFFNHVASFDYILIEQSELSGQYLNVHNGCLTNWNYYKVDLV
jgi:hypothetical protein